MKFNWKIAESIDEIKNYFLDCPKDKLMAFDTESTSLPLWSPVLGYSFYNRVTEGLFIPTDTFFDKGFNPFVIAKLLNAYFVHKAVAHNAKYDFSVLESVGINLPNLVADSILKIHIYDSNLEKNLEKRVAQDLGWKKPTLKELVNKKWDKIDWTEEGILEILAEYSCGDTYGTFMLNEEYTYLIENDGLTKIHDKIELPLVNVLKEMYMRGVTIDTVLLADIDKKLDRKLEEIQKQIYEEAGCVFNINSSKQTAEVIYDKLGVECVRFTKGGARSADAKVFEMLDQQDVLIGKLLNSFSKLGKLSSGYTKSIPNMLYGDNKLRCNFNSTGAKTGRFSSDTPNLQNQPNNKEFPIRQAFIPSKGYGFIVADYSQIELRVMAHVADDKEFKRAFLSGDDIHQMVGDSLGISRSGGKTVNFGVLFGLGAPSLASMLKVSESKASNIIRGYGEKYTGYSTWKKRTEDMITRTGKSKTIFGRVRKMPGAFSNHKGMYYSALRQGVNHVVQGSAADIIKLAMIELHRRFKEEKLDCHILLQVHDELVIEYPLNGDAGYIMQLVKDVMEKTTLLSVPLEVDAKFCKNWHQMKSEESTYVYESKQATSPELGDSFPYYILNN